MVGRVLRFRTVLLLHMGLLVLAVVGATAVATTVVLDRAARRERSEDLVRAREGLGELLDHRRVLHEAQLNLLAEEPRLKSVVVTEGVDGATVRDVVDELRRALRCDRLIVLDGEGRVLADDGRPAWASGDPAADPLIAAALAGRAGTAIWSGDGAAHQMIARPITVGETVHGAIAVGHEVGDALATQLARETGNAVVIALAGNVVAVSPLRPGAPLAEPHAAAVARATEAADRPLQLDVAGQRVLAVGAPLGEGLRASLLRSLEPALAARRRLMLVVTAIALGALVISLLVAAASARRLGRPLDALVAFTGRVAEGRLDERVAVTGVAEVRALAESMNAMAARLDESHGRLVLADQLASVGTLAAGVAHEINNPLAYVVGNLDMLALDLEELKAELPAGRLAEAHEMMSDTRDGVDRVRRIVRDLKVFSRAGEDDHGPVDVARVVELAVNMTRHEVRHRARLIKDFGEVPAVQANEGRLGQVLVNLIVNAAHAIPEGNVEENEIRVTTRRTADGRVRLEVRDTGSGIPPEIRRRIFDPFFTTKEVGIGTGLGLSICHAIVAGLGGEIGVDSEPGKGSTFSVTLLAAAGAGAGARMTVTSETGGRRGRVLVVDDEPMLGTVVKRALGGDHDVTTVTDGQQALEALARDRYDIVLCDLMMPRMTGMEVHAELSRRDRDFADRIIFITGGAFTAQARKFVAEVPNRCFEKPIDMAALKQVIRERLRG